MKIIYLSLLLLLAFNYGKSHKSIWEIYVNNTQNSLKLKGKGLFGTFDDESNIVDGDIMVDPDEPNPRKIAEGITPRISKRPGSTIQSNEMKAFPLFSWHQKMWTRRTIPYKITSSSSRNRNIIVKSLKTIEKNTGNCLRFRPCTNCGDWWLEFFYGQGCFSGIGKKYWRTGPTKISIGENCNYADIIQHEVLHALGFPHEQSRVDRDNYVKIYLKYVYPGMESNFEKSDIGDTFYFGTKYDYRSIMHYSATAFSTQPSRFNTIQKVGDPSAKLGSGFMTATDIKELKKMYFCDIRPNNNWNGWSNWINTRCMCTSDEKYCTKSKVRICIGRKKCRGENQQYGTQSKSSTCTKEEAKKVEKSQNGNWGRWKPYSKCKSDCDCGWGYQTRTRSCDSPKPINGNPCSGWDRQTTLCRRKRCTGYTKMSKYDDNFDKKTKKWEMTRFVRRMSKVAGIPSPKQDHTYEITQNRGGYFAVAWGKNKNGLLKSPSLRATKKRKCLMFYYYMEGKNIEKKNALSAYIRYRKGGKNNYINLPFSKKGHQGNYWRRAAINIPAMKYSHQVVIEAKFDKWRTSAIGIDDIFVDYNSCLTGLSACRDIRRKTYCVRRGNDGYCNHSNALQKRIMFSQCCATCQDKKYRYKRKGKAKEVKCKKLKQKKTKKPKKAPKKKTGCTDKATSCSTWSKMGECKNNPNYMLPNCCKSCQNARKGA